MVLTRGVVRASRLGVLTGAVIILAVSIASVRWIGAGSVRRLLGVGLLWSALTLSSEFLKGRRGCAA